MGHDVGPLDTSGRILGILHGAEHLHGWLVDRFGPWLCVRARQWHARLPPGCRSQFDAGDLVQMVWSEAIPYLAGNAEFRSLDSSWTRGVLAFLGQLLRNLSTDLMREAGRRPSTLKLSSDLVGSTTGPSGLVARRETAMRLLEALERLPETERLLLFEHFVDGVPIAELAANLGLTRSAASKRIWRTIRELRQRFPELIPVEWESMD